MVDHLLFIPTDADNEDATEAAIADLTERKTLVCATSRSPRRWSGSLTGNFTPNVEAIEVFKRRLKASRFAVASY